MAQIISGSFHTTDFWRASSAKENGIAGVIRHTQLRRPLFPSSFGVFRSWERKTGIGNMTAPRARPDTFFGWKAVGAAAAMYFALPFSTILGSLGSPLAGWIRDVTGSYWSAWQLAILILTIGLVSLILACPPVHPSISRNRTNSISG